MRLSTQNIARACARHPWRTISAWGVLIVLSFAAIALLLGSGLTTDGVPTNNPESDRAATAIGRAFPPDPRTSVTDIVVVRSESYAIDSPRYRAFVADLLEQGQATGIVGSATSWFATRAPSLVSEDRHAAIVPVFITDPDRIKDLTDVVEQADEDPAFSVAMTGENTLSQDIGELSQHDLKTGELQFGLPAALLILLLVFGAVVAGLVPLLMAIVSIIVALGLTALLGQAFELSFFVTNMLIGMGLALGIDYSLFIVSRYREERGRRREKYDAIAAAGSTASRAVLFSGTAFVVAMFGMLLVPSSIMMSLAAGAILVGIVSVIGALTLLPALLGLIGDGVNRLRIPFIGSRSIEETNPEGRVWHAIVERVQRHPVVSLVAATALLLAAAAPVIGLHVGANSVSTLPDNLTSKRGFLALQRDFPATTTDPVQIVVRDYAQSGAGEAVRELRARLAANPRFGLGAISVSADGDTALLVVPIQGDPAGEKAVAAVRELRADGLDDTFAGTQAEALVGGATSESVDYFDGVSDPAPYVFLFVLGLTFILLTVAFRSIVVAATSVALNLLSVGAAYGLLVLVFQHGVGAGLLGFQHVEAIEAWVPLFLFSVLFGLSMDYQVFLLSRIKERYVETGDTREAVAWGVSSTARLITGAALIIVAVFWGFAMGDMVMFQQMGFGVAIALLIDATIIRSVLVPATMTLLGRWNWYLPSWLKWLPELHVEGVGKDTTPLVELEPAD